MGAVLVLGFSVAYRNRSFPFEVSCPEEARVEMFRGADFVELDGVSGFTNWSEGHKMGRDRVFEPWAMSGSVNNGICELLIAKDLAGDQIWVVRYASGEDALWAFGIDNPPGYPAVLDGPVRYTNSCDGVANGVVRCHSAYLKECVVVQRSSDELASYRDWIEVIGESIPDGICDR